MIDISNIALITPVEANKNVIVNNCSSTRFYEDELIRCISSWRKNGGYLKNINIYALHMNNSTINETTIKRLKQLDVNYIDDFYSESKNFKIEFLNEPYTGLYFESLHPIKEEITIKIDLDMQLIKPIRQELIEKAYESVVIGQYSEKTSLFDERKKYNGILPFDTNFIITHRKFNFYKTYFEKCFDDKILEDEQWKEMKSRFGDYYLEEFVIDYIYQNIFDNIYPVQYYQYGEGYETIDQYPTDKIKDIMFIHEHIYRNNKFPREYDPFKERMNYMRLSKLYERQ